jgi:hypothetical protein
MVIGRDTGEGIDWWRMTDTRDTRYPSDTVHKGMRGKGGCIYHRCFYFPFPIP